MARRPLRPRRGSSCGFRGFPPMVRGPRVTNTPGPGGCVVASARSFSVLVVDESEAFLASTRHWIESRRDLRLVGTRPQRARGSGRRRAAVPRSRDRGGRPSRDRRVPSRAHAQGARERPARRPRHLPRERGRARRGLRRGSGRLPREGGLQRRVRGDPGDVEDRAARPRRNRVTTPAKPARRESRTVPDP